MDTSLPKHIAIIMDGNGRWAQAQNLPRVQGHIAGIAAVKRIVKACLERGISVLSLFTFSSENWLRPAEEVHALMDLFLKALKQEIQELNEQRVRLRFIGNLSQLSPILQENILASQTLTQHNQALTLNIAMNYGGKWDIMQSVRQLIQMVVNQQLELDDVDEAQLAQHLSTADLPDPDLFIRTSGECRISNFFLWQLSYTELFFSPKYWPDFNETDFALALQDYRQRQRRFGQL